MTSRKGFTFPGICRLHCRREFDLAWKKGKKKKTSHFQVIVMERPCGPIRLGLTVSRKVGGAVARNRIKRLLREFFRYNYHHLPKACDLVFIAKKGAADLSYELVSGELAFLRSEFNRRADNV